MNQEFKMHISPPSFLHCFCRSLGSVGHEWYNNGREMNANTRGLDSNWSSQKLFLSYYNSAESVTAIFFAKCMELQSNFIIMN